MTFLPPQNCDKRGCDAGVYIDVSACGRLTEPEYAGTGTEGAITASDALTQLQLVQDGGLPIPFTNPSKFCLLETSEGDISASDQGNVPEKQRRSRMRLSGGAQPQWVQDRICYKSYTAAKRDLEISFDLTCDALYAGNILLEASGCMNIPVAALLTNDFFAEATPANPLIGWYGEWILDNNSITFPYEDDTVANVTLKPHACGCGVWKVRYDGATLFNADQLDGAGGLVPLTTIIPSLALPQGSDTQVTSNEKPKATGQTNVPKPNNQGSKKTS